MYLKNYLIAIIALSLAIPYLSGMERTHKETNSDLAQITPKYEGSFISLEGNIKSLDGIENVIVSYKGKPTLLKDVPNLYLDLSNNQIQDIQPLMSLTKLKRLYLSNNKIQDIASLSSLTNLNALYAANNQIQDITPLENLTNLRELNLRKNKIQDIKPLEHLNNLRDLTLSSNHIQDITPLSSLINLNKLDAANNQIRSITLPAKLATLMLLDLSHNSIKNITPLASLIDLRELHLSNNQIHDISPLTNLTLLGRLDLSNNKVEDISPLSKLTGLFWLNLSNNLISEVPQNFTNLSQLEILDLSDNKLTKLPLKIIQCIAKKECLSDLRFLFIWNNPLGPLQPDGSHKPVETLADITFDKPLPNITRTDLARISEVIKYGNPSGYLTILPKELLVELSKYRKETERRRK